MLQVPAHICVQFCLDSNFPLNILIRKCVRRFRVDWVLRIHQCGEKQCDSGHSCMQDGNGNGKDKTANPHVSICRLIESPSVSQDAWNIHTTM
jgi:hypothetical protein